MGPKQLKRILTQVKERRFAVPLRLIYLCGLRLSEALHIEVRDIHQNPALPHGGGGHGVFPLWRLRTHGRLAGVLRPPRLQCLRHFGYLSAAARERYKRLRALLRAGAVRLLLPDSRSEAEADCLKSSPAGGAKRINIVRCCPGCGGSDLRFLCVLRPHNSRAPPIPAP